MLSKEELAESYRLRSLKTAEVLRGRKRPGVGKKVGDAQRGKPKIKCVEDCTCGKHKSGQLSKTQYRIIFGMKGHPLSITGYVYEHRMVLYDAIGPGPHECHWNSLLGCGRTELTWGTIRGLVVDHLNGDKTDNRLENLVPSCQKCNTTRHHRLTKVDK